ncbi:hypothetical protein SAR11G3_00047 [Candidatus Pelagibacter sp. IMCC9063]|nr:hypothetical protein SAR11G3_00047 [Candidatus Pelagibacter sp. IMCC9063]
MVFFKLFIYNFYISVKNYFATERENIFMDWDILGYSFIFSYLSF